MYNICLEKNFILYGRLHGQNCGYNILPCTFINFVNFDFEKTEYHIFSLTASIMSPE